MDSTPPTRKIRRRRWLLVALLAAAVSGGWYGFWRYHLKRFAAVRPGVLYRVGQPSLLGLKYLARRYGVRTVVSAQTFDIPLCQGLYDPGKPSGPREAETVRQLGMNHVQWPMGTEENWPFPTPWQFEAFFALLDDPANYPVALHCAGGKHRTGSLAALFRLEYDRWPVERVLDEMYAFDFGGQQPTQELNLRTYVRRPLPNSEQLAAMRAALQSGDQSTSAGRADYAALVRNLRAEHHEPDVQNRLAAYFADDGPFAVCLAQRLVELPDEPLAKPAAALAARLLADPAAAEESWSMAAAVIADFGTPEQQATLQKLLAEEIGADPPTPRYRALVRGVTNRYTPNRRAWLRMILDDQRPCVEPEAAPRRYCDVAMVRLAVIENQGFPWDKTDQSKIVFSWDLGVQKALHWLDERPDALRLAPLEPPTGENQVAAEAVPLPKKIQRLPR